MKWDLNVVDSECDTWYSRLFMDRMNKKGFLFEFCLSNNNSTNQVSYKGYPKPRACGLSKEIYNMVSTLKLTVPKIRITSNQKLSYKQYISSGCPNNLHYIW